MCRTIQRFSSSFPTFHNEATRHCIYAGANTLGISITKKTGREREIALKNKIYFTIAWKSIFSRIIAYTTGDET